MRARLDALGARWPWFGAVLAVQKRVDELGGGFVAAAVTLSLFLSLFPLLLVATAVLGFVSSGDAGFAAEVVDTLGLSGAAAETVTDALATAEEQRATASIIGFVGALWSALGVVGAIGHAVDRAWQVEARGIADKAFGVLWLLGAAVLLGGSVVLSAVLRILPGWAWPINVVGGIAVNIAFFLWTFRILTARALPLRAHLPGAVLGGIGFQVLTVVGAVYVPRAVASSSALYGSIGVVFAILAWLFFFGRLLVYCAALNVVRFEGRAGTVRVEVHAPRLPGEVALEANRSAVVVSREE